MSKTYIVYKDVAVGADEDAAVAATGAAAFAQPAELPFGVEPAPVASLELNEWGLDGSGKFIEDQSVAFWSDAISGEDCVFAVPPTIEISFDNQYSLLGLYLSFDAANYDFCTDLNIKYYQGSTLKADYDFAPDAPTYFCEGKAESFNKIVITLRKTNLPQRRAKLTKVLFGIVREFGMADIRSAKITSETDLISAQLPISRLTWTLDSRKSVDFMFQLKQPIEVQSGANLLGVFYVSSAKRTSSSVYNITCEDAFGILADTPYAGGNYISGISAKTLFGGIIGDTFDIIYDNVEDATLYGLILPSNKREALQQVLFAWGVCVSTFGVRGIRVFAPSAEMKAVDKDRAYVGAAVETKPVVTRVEVTAHTYAQSSSGSVTIGTTKYSDTKTVYTVSNPNVTAADKENVITVDGGTLVSTRNGQAVAQRVYDYYMRRNTATGKIVLAGEKPGDLVSLPSTWSTAEGNISKLDINLSNTVAASVTAIAD